MGLGFGGVLSNKKLYIQVLLLLIVLAFFGLFSLFESGQELFLCNVAEGSISIKHILLNNQVVGLSERRLDTGRTDFVKVEKMARYPDKNVLEVILGGDGKEIKRQCVFLAKKDSCYEEVLIKENEMWCEEFCSSVFD